MATRRITAFPVAAAMVLSACAGVETEPVSGPSPGALAGEMEPASELARAARAMRAELTQLAALTQAGRTPARAYETPGGGRLARGVTMRWAGPVEPAVRRLARSLGYAFEASGEPPVPAPVVYVDASDESAFRVLEDIGWQLGADVALVVDEGARRVEIVYAGGPHGELSQRRGPL